MKNHSLKTVLAAAGLALCATSPVFGSEAETIFKRMDSDGDGKVTAVEHAAYAETTFKQSDTNYDGQVSVAECNAAQAAHGKKIKKNAAATHVRLVDTDGSGQISVAENETFARSAFTRADKNNDGSLSEDEVEDAHKAMEKELKD